MPPKRRIAASSQARLLFAAMVAACGEPATRGEMGSTAVGETAFVATDTARGPTATAELSDANIVALLDRASVADSSAGAFASAKATAPAVRHFAQAMMADHHRLRMLGADLVKKLGVTPQPPAYDPVTPRAQQAMDSLESAPKGAVFDRSYIRQEIAAHREVLDLVDQLYEAAGSPELRDMIEQARPLIEHHLKQAQAIEKELGSAA